MTPPGKNVIQEDAVNYLIAALKKEAAPVICGVCQVSGGAVGLNGDEVHCVTDKICLSFVL